MRPGLSPAAQSHAARTPQTIGNWRARGTPRPLGGESAVKVTSFASPPRHSSNTNSHLTAAGEEPSERPKRRASRVRARALPSSHLRLLSRLCRLSCYFSSSILLRFFAFFSPPQARHHGAHTHAAFTSLLLRAARRGVDDVRRRTTRPPPPGRAKASAEKSARRT